ncbi:MAG TPA: hypothetical protein VLY21_00205 [Nitrososphaerales archaeon]|nr:hypothetical protein [Nitrososphaerales archaeon]
MVKGMRSFWSQQLADMAEEYESMKQRIEVYARDNEILNRLHSQNLELARLLDEASKTGEGA